MKKAQRELALLRRRALTAEQRREMSAAICEKLLTLPELAGVKTVFSYLAAWDEVDLSYVNQTLAARGITVAYPVCFEKGHMEAYIPESESAVETGAYGIKNPVMSRSKPLEPENIDLVLVPCVAFDADKNRLGHGAGYYDRYLPHCSNAVFVLVGFEAQRLDSISCDIHDVKMDIIVTENAVLR